MSASTLLKERRGLYQIRVTQTGRNNLDEQVVGAAARSFDLVNGHISTRLCVTVSIESREFHNRAYRVKLCGLHIDCSDRWWMDRRFWFTSGWLLVSYEADCSENEIYDLEAVSLSG